MAAKTAPMGWNSWDCYGAFVTEDRAMAQRRIMFRKRKLQEGWNWYESG